MKKIIGLLLVIGALTLLLISIIPSVYSIAEEKRIGESGLQVEFKVFDDYGEQIFPKTSGPYNGKYLLTTNQKYNFECTFKYVDPTQAPYGYYIAYVVYNDMTETKTGSSAKAFTTEELNLPTGTLLYSDYSSNAGETTMTCNIKRKYTTWNLGSFMQTNDGNWKKLADDTIKIYYIEEELVNARNVPEDLPGATTSSESRSALYKNSIQVIDGDQDPYYLLINLVELSIEGTQQPDKENRVVALQALLKAEGSYTGKLTGVFDGKTKTALGDWVVTEEKLTDLVNNLIENGKLPKIAQLGSSSGGSSGNARNRRTTESSDPVYDAVKSGGSIDFTKLSTLK